jgi:hypothetical protein
MGAVSLLPPAPEAVIVGPHGKVGMAFSSLLPSARLISRGQSIADALAPLASTPTPILVCTTNDALEAVVAATPSHRRSDLIFLQNGMLAPELDRWGLTNASTQVLLSLAAGTTGTFTDGGQTVAYGPWAPWFADLLHKNDLKCDIIDDTHHFHILAAQKLLWACIFWAMSAALDGAPVGRIVDERGDEVAALVKEMVQVGSGAGLGTDLDPAVATAAVVAYSQRIPASRPSRDMALREFRWRNGWFLEAGGGLEAQPLHAEWLRRAGVDAAAAQQLFKKKTSP